MGSGDDLLEQRRLADSRLAADDEGPGGALPGFAEERFQEVSLSIATNQHLSKSTPPAREHRVAASRHFGRGDSERPARRFTT